MGILSPNLQKFSATKISAYTVYCQYSSNGSTVTAKHAVVFIINHPVNVSLTVCTKLATLMVVIVTLVIRHPLEFMLKQLGI